MSKRLVRQGRDGDPLRIVQEIKIWPFHQMHKPECVPENETHKILCDFELQTDHLVPARRPGITDIVLSLFHFVWRSTTLTWLVQSTISDITQLLSIQSSGERNW